MHGMVIACELIPSGVGLGATLQQLRLVGGLAFLLLLGTYVDNTHVWELPSHQPGWLE